jgi:hypothetical protein
MTDAKPRTMSVDEAIQAWEVLEDTKPTDFMMQQRAILDAVAAGAEERYKEPLVNLVRQYALRNRHGHLWTGGMSALEYAYEALGWDDPHDDS